ncbi:hypothetical protein CCM_00662 [Cordyceps militaris CM01]|uniref:Uncharacterized protein n=1 Tax=Cordyceps militaris (strain CM01) TaxID=983644 RepID=G3J5E6_CORMM|nr:uncharacterized protein CCM_00662 [Cordyceps militaris CM01]EGX96007.1 hypothetical protein CCM_00662 [Cordyceps militaris CM01]
MHRGIAFQPRHANEARVCLPASPQDKVFPGRFLAYLVQPHSPPRDTAKASSVDEPACTPATASPGPSRQGSLSLDPETTNPWPRSLFPFVRTAPNFSVADHRFFTADLL